MHSAACQQPATEHAVVRKPPDEELTLWYNWCPQRILIQEIN
jgi:hypothetical protein